VSTLVDDKTQTLTYGLFNGSSSEIGIDGGTIQIVNAGTQGMDGVTIGARRDLADHWWAGNIQEIILYPSDQSSNRTGIETNINDFYNIY